MNAPHGRLAFKTGTSYGYRDAWAVGFDGRMTVGVWVGRPDGAPVPGLVGRVSAAPILFDAFARSGLTPVPLPAAPKGALFAATGQLPPPLRHFNAGDGLMSSSTRRASCFRPTAPGWSCPAAGQPDPLALKIAGGAAPLTVMVNGVPLPARGSRRTLFFQPEAPVLSG